MKPLRLEYVVPKILAKVEQVHEHQARSCANHDREKEVLLVSEPNQEAERSLHQTRDKIWTLQLSCSVSKDEDDDDQGDDDERTDSDNDGDDFVHPKSTDDEDSDEEIHDVNVEGDELDEEETNKEDEGDELYRDMFWLLRLLSHHFLSARTLPPPPTPLITHLQQTPAPIPATVPSSSLQDLPNFGSLFRFDHRLKALENGYSEFKHTNQFAEDVSLIPGIDNSYLANKMNEAIKTAVQLKSDRLRDEAQAKNKYFINKLDYNIKNIIKDQVKEQVKEKTSHAIAANLSKLKLKKILIDKMKSKKSIYRSDEQKNLYKALVEAYESKKLILDTYGDTVTLKRRRNDEDKDKEPSTGSNWGSKKRRARKDLELTSAQKEKTYKTTEGSKSYHESTGGTEDQPDEETAQLPD
nr:hypothetical protein [Tanacetum cinerariifolium]